MIKELRPAIMMVVLLTLLTGIVYPVAITGVAQIIFPSHANGSLVKRDGKIVGSSLIGQVFTDEKYFHGRPSATNDTDPNDSTKTVDAPYNAANSMGSNLGPTSKVLVDRVTSAAKDLKTENDKPIPVDLVTTSSSGLDPDITPAAAEFQIPRVAKARKMSEAAVRDLVAQHTSGRSLGFVGEPYVRVLELNMALDDLKKR